MMLVMDDLENGNQQVFSTYEGHMSHRACLLHVHTVWEQQHGRLEAAQRKL
jgi:hypothetical protein